MGRARNEYEWYEANKFQIRFKMDNIVLRLQEFMENEARSCSMDFGCVTPGYVFRVWGGSEAIEDIAAAMEQIELPM